MDAVTLGAVAKETKLPRPAVYAHFSSRHDLIAELTKPAVEIHAERESAPEGSADATEAPEVEAGYDDLMRAQADALHELTKQVIVPKPHQRDAMETALSRMEARLSVSEQSLAALDQKVGERLKGLTAETTSLGETLQGLKSRVEKFEGRQQAALAELRLEVHMLTHPGEPEPVIPEPLEQAYEPEAPAAEQSDETPAQEPAEPKIDDPEKAPSYLHSARLAAIAAAAHAAAAPPRRRSRYRWLRGKRGWALIAAVAVLVAWFDVYVFAHYEPAQGGVAPTVRAMPRPAKVALSPQDQLVRGLKYLNGTGVPVNVDKAHRLLEHAALRGQPVAQNLMGVLYQTGTGVPGDMAAAVRWYEASARQGNLKAMTNLGKLYAGGWEQGTDFVKAAQWFAKAAACGDVDAQFDLAILYERGEGVSRSTAEAYKWYTIAGTNGDSHAAARAGMLAAQMPPDELQAAVAAIIAFKPVPADRAANETPQSKA